MSVHAFVHRLASTALLLLVLGACTTEPPAAEPERKARAGCVALTLGRESFEVAVAADDERRRIGLSGCQTLARNEGLLFLYRVPAPRSFWMKDCFVALDILFLDAGGRILNVVTMQPPHSGTADLDLPFANSVGHAAAVLEVCAGTAVRLALKPGDVVRWSAFNGVVQ